MCPDCGKEQNLKDTINLFSVLYCWEGQLEGRVALFVLEPRLWERTELERRVLSCSVAQIVGKDRVGRTKSVLCAMMARIVGRERLERTRCCLCAVVLL